MQYIVQARVPLIEPQGHAYFDDLVSAEDPLSARLEAIQRIDDMLHISARGRRAMHFRPESISVQATDPAVLA